MKVWDRKVDPICEMIMEKRGNPSLEKKNKQTNLSTTSRPIILLAPGYKLGTARVES